MTGSAKTAILKTRLTHQQIEQRLPHAGKMCLLHEVIAADEQSLTATANSHLEADNPLRVDGKIAAINGVEYAAQAMAVHGSFLSDKPRAGFIATLRNIELHRPYLPENGELLYIKVQQLMSDNNGFTYQFTIDCDQQSVVSGRVTVFLIRS